VFLRNMGCSSSSSRLAAFYPGLPVLRRVFGVPLSGRFCSGVNNFSGSNTDRFIRAAALQELSKSPLVETNFLIREQFLGGALLPSGEIDFAAMQLVRSEFEQNMVESDYILCARGAGNFSYRLYETLSCGRIPVFVDTDCVLPYQTEIDWESYCVWVSAKDIKHIGEKVAEFHESLSEQMFANLQQECRRLWESYLSPEGFFQNFYKHFI